MSRKAGVRCRIVADLRLDEREPERSGLRLIEWAAACGASGVITSQVSRALAERFAQEARARGLEWYAAAPSRRPEAPVLTKALTLNRSLGGPSHAGSLYPDEFAGLVAVIREHEAVLAGTPSPGQDAGAQTPLALTPSLVARRPLRRGAVVAADDLKVIPELRGISAARLPELVGRRLLFDREPEEGITFGVLEPWTPMAQGGEPAEVSIVIRAKNEAAWLRRSLPALRLQSRPPAEIIVVDNASADETAAVARAFGCRVLPIADEEFKFGVALNRGIAAAKRRWVVSLSAHCVPVHDRWLEALLAPGHEAAFTAGVYGRQEPLPDTGDFDKRDLWTTFGVEPRVQRGRDFFFHNANSLIRRDVWQRLPFDEVQNGVEDRDWAKRALQEGYRILYEPLASVHHWHGIHQGRNEERAKRVVKVIELIQQHEPAGSPGP